jgi:hypothetical protein
VKKLGKLKLEYTNDANQNGSLENKESRHVQRLGIEPATAE